MARSHPGVPQISFTAKPTIMNRKDFDLAKAKSGHPLVTRDGRTPSEFHRFETMNSDRKNVAVIDGYGYSINDFGKRYDGEDDPRDLFLAPVEVTMWVNVGKSANGTYFITPTLYETEGEAGNNNYPPIHIATVPVTFTI